MNRRARQRVSRARFLRWRDRRGRFPVAARHAQRVPCRYPRPVSFFGGEFGRELIREGLVVDRWRPVHPGSAEELDEWLRNRPGSASRRNLSSFKPARLRRSRIQSSTCSARRGWDRTPRSTVRKTSGTWTAPRLATLTHCFHHARFHFARGFLDDVRPKYFRHARSSSVSGRCRMRSVMTHVFPVPAPAITSNGPLPCVMARC